MSQIPIYLTKTSQILYFFLCMVFLAFAIIYQSSNESAIHNNIFLLFTLLLVPIFNQIFEILKEGMKNLDPKNVGELLFLIVFPCILLGVFLSGYIGFGFLLITFVIFTLYQKIDAQVFFVGALVIFLYIAFYLVFGQNSQAEVLSIQAYYLLIAGVVVQIIQSIRTPKTLAL